nr:death ligand signal enhancer [Pogona vitticeps]
MLWRLLWSFSRGVRPPGGGGAVGVSRPRSVAPIRPPEGESAQSEEGRQDRHRQHKAHGYGKLSHLYCPLDAFTWSALVVLAVELAKQVRWLNFVQPGGVDGRIHHLESQLAVLPQHQHSVLLTGPSSSSSRVKEQIFKGVDSGCARKNPTFSKSSRQKEYQLFSETEDFLCPPSTSHEPGSHLSPLQSNLKEETSLNEAASQMQHVFQASISVASNILGLKNMQDGQHKMAFSCFKMAADRNYDKAQFNVGMCYEHGRGTTKNMAKALFYYRQAARQGHTMAQYHYAKWLLHHWPRADNNDGSLKEAMGFLDQAATSGLVQAQAYLGMLHLKGMEPGKQRVQKCLHMTAGSSRDSSCRFRLGDGYEKHFEIHQKHQQPSARNRPADEKTEVTTEEEIAVKRWHQTPLQARNFSSSPCLQSLDQPLASHVGQPAVGLLHSWSTGSLSDFAGGSLHGIPSPAFSDGLTFRLQSLAWSPGTVIG